MIQWYPGHMAKAIREINEKIKIVDVVIVLLDARCPISSFNPLLEESLINRRVLYVLTKKDKADPLLTSKWIDFYKQNGKSCVAVDARELKNAKTIIKETSLLMKEKREKDALKGLKPRAIKTMIVGIPNVGKSTLINALVGKRVTSVGDRPGVTKVQQWIKINQDLELLDTPGVLWPKFENQTYGMHLAISGGINDSILPIDDVCRYFVEFLQLNYPNALSNRYQSDFSSCSSDEIIEAICKKQHFYKDSNLDIDKTSLFILQEARNGFFGRITLDRFEND